MKFLAAVVMMIVLLASSSGIAQSPARKRASRRPVAATPNNPTTETKSAPQPSPTVTSSTAPADTTIPTDLAILDGQTITVSDINPTVAQEIAKLGEQIARARREILDVQINTVLLEIESRKRKIPAQAIYDLEVAKRITEPTEAEIDRKSTRLNSSHRCISYAVFCLKK